MKAPVEATGTDKTKKSANRKFNQETIEKRKASRELKFDFKASDEEAMPVKGHRSKYDFEKLNTPGKSSFFWPASQSLSISIRNSARTKFNRILESFPRTENGVVGYRFWLKAWVDPTEANAATATSPAGSATAEAEADSAQEAA